MNQKGIAHILLILILLILVVGIGIAVYLTQFTQVFKPKASEAGTIHQVLITGQSNAVGWRGWPPLSTTQPYNNLMLSDNWSPMKSGVTFVPLTVFVSQDKKRLDPENDPLTETIAGGLANSVTAATSNSYQILMTLNGRSGVKYEELKKGGLSTDPGWSGPCCKFVSEFALGLDQARVGKKLAEDQAKGFSVGAVAVQHGETDNFYGGGPLYKDYLNEWARDYNQDLKAITGQTEDIPMLITQISAWQKLPGGQATIDPPYNVPLAQLEASEENPGKIVLVGPQYFLTYFDGLHLNNHGYRQLGEYYGKVYKKVVIDKQRWVPLSPNSITISGNIITTILNVPVAPIQIDTAQVLAKENYGFEYYDDSGNPAKITNVTITSGDTLQITLDKIPIGNNKRLRYAFTGTQGALSGVNFRDNGAPRGNIRDSDTTPSLYGYNLNNWLVHFDKPIAANKPPEGTQEGVVNSSCLVGGWAYDPDAPGNSIQVSVYRDADADHGGTLIGTYPTDKLRADVNGARNLPADSKHGYTITFTPQSGLFTGTPHNLYVYGHDDTDRTGIRLLHPLLLNSPQTITCPVPAGTIKKDTQFWFFPNFYYGVKNYRPVCDNTYVPPTDDPTLPCEARKNPVDYKEFWDDEEKLKNILPNISTFGFFPNDEDVAYYPKMTALLEKYKVPLTTSIGGTNSFGGPDGPYCKNHQAGELTADFELKTIKKMYDEGLKLDSVVMDDPISRTIALGSYPTNCNYTIDESVQEVIDAMKAIHKVYPNLKIGMNTNFANWRYAGTPPWWGPTWGSYNVADYKNVVDKLFLALNAAGEKLEFFHVDYPYEHTKPGPNSDPGIDWMKRILDLETQVKNHGVRFGVYFNAAMMSSDAEAFKGTIDYVNEYRVRGGSPDNYVFMSWGEAPHKLLPVSEPYTYTNLLATAMRIVDTPPVGVLDGIDQCATVVGWACDKDTPSKPVDIHFIADGKIVSIPKADQEGGETIAAQCEGHDKHRFRFDVPSELKDDKPHTINLFAINSNSFGQNTQLPGSPITMQCLAKKIGDLNGDGNIDFADFNIFARYYKDKDLRADFNGDSDVTLADLNILIRNFGQ